MWKKVLINNLKMVKVRLKGTTNYGNKLMNFSNVFCIFLFICCGVFVQCSVANHPPRFLIHGQTEIVLRLKEGNDTPAGK